MIDFDDAELVTVAVPFSVIGLIVIAIVWFFALRNQDECEHKRCPNESKPRLMEHDCLCVERATP